MTKQHIMLFWGEGGEGGRGEGCSILGITGPSPSYPSFFTLLSIQTIQDLQLKGGQYLKLGKKHLITLSAHNLFL